MLGAFVENNPKVFLDSLPGLESFFKWYHLMDGQFFFFFLWSWKEQLMFGGKYFNRCVIDTYTNIFFCLTRLELQLEWRCHDFFCI
jgi:hypothetical protein